MASLRSMLLFQVALNRPWFSGGHIEGMLQNREPKLAPQLLVLLTAAMVWLLWPRLSVWGFLLAYGLAWIFLNYFPAPLPRLRLSVGLGVPLAALAATAIATGSWRHGGDLMASEGLRGLPRLVEDRLRLENQPSIAPPVIFADHPQTLYVFAPGSERVQLTLGGNTSPVDGQAVGEGLFRLAYDPRYAGWPGDAAVVDAKLKLDDQEFVRSLKAVRPLAHPRWFASFPKDGRAATVSEETDELIVIDRKGLVVRRMMGDGPTDTVFFDDGRLLAVSHRYAPEIRILETRSWRVVQTVKVGAFQARMAKSPDAGLLAVAVQGLNPGIQFIDLTRLERDAWLPLEFIPDWLSFGPDRNTLVVSSPFEQKLHRFSLSAGGWRDTGSLGLGRPAVTLAPVRDGHDLLVSVTDFRSDNNAHQGNHFIQDQLLTVDVANWVVRRQYLTARRSQRQDDPGNLDRGVSPIGIAETGDGSLLVSFAGTEEIWRLDRSFARPPEIFDFDLLGLISPHGVADLGGGYWAASSPAGGAIAIVDPNGKLAARVAVAPKDEELLAQPLGSIDRQNLLTRAGERAFYESTRSGVSCQSCHLHGGSDHSRHNLGLPISLRTLTSRGIFGTSPYLRDASFPRVRDLNDHLALSLYRGYLRETVGRANALEAWVESLPRSVNPRMFRARDGDLERAGAAAFVKARCVLCHTPPAFTNLGQHSVRALFPEFGSHVSAVLRLDTPSLLALHDKSGFLFDGRAQDLVEVIDKFNPANRHGDTKALTEGERLALIAFLESL